MRTFYVPVEDGADDVTPVVARAVALIEEADRAVESSARPPIEAASPAEVDELADLADVIGGDERVRTQHVLARLVEHDPDHYGGWSFAALAAMLAEHGITARKSHGVMTVHAADVTAALARRDPGETPGDAGGEQPGTRGVLPATSPDQSPSNDQGKHGEGRRGGANPDTR
ncbi:hypothetical protein [Amycolatopsis sp. GM8]|uniref:hypothetical protein n=1 Tax=Amycolatopsis sp. GM8 TaxID=2896530 RepID=UPI001F19CCA0|nr:hypothetical protein [Amycolatopsis sp. GM8]